MNFKKTIKYIFRNMGYEITKLGEVDLLESLICKKNHKNFFFLQIGANNGKRFDPIFNVVKSLNLRGLAIEPVEEYYNELVENYKNSSVIPVNKAIYEENKKVSIFRVKQSAELPEWSKGIASLNPDHYKKSQTDEKNIVEEVVDAITFEKLFRDYNVKHIDLLQIDTEGYDYNLLKLFPFEKYQPSIIHFEHGLPNSIMTIEQVSEINMLLLKLGYKTIMKEYDCIGYK
ncbi:FkbM family methyltransferase [Francisella philomiragia]|uniref:FkbM family methyltransferase n=1 Tax=Francisella philomiragia TaxID=28110 RepID=UPI00351903CA